MNTAPTWPATRPPAGRAQALAAIATLTASVPALRRVDQARLYEILRPYWAAGWCVRDVLAALDAPPAGEPYTGHGVAWTSTDEPDRMLRRVQDRLRAWWLGDGANDRASIMVGAYTATARAMADRAADQLARATARQLEYDRRHHAARPDAPDRQNARRIAAAAASRTAAAARARAAAERST